MSSILQPSCTSAARSRDPRRWLRRTLRAVCPTSALFAPLYYSFAWSVLLPRHVRPRLPNSSVGGRLLLAFEKGRLSLLLQQPRSTAPKLLVVVLPQKPLQHLFSNSMAFPSLLEQLPPASPSRSESLELKTSPMDDTEQGKEVKQMEKRGVVDVFLGRDRETLQKDPIVWREGWTPFAESLGRRMKGVLTKRFLYVCFLFHCWSCCLRSTGADSPFAPLSQSLCSVGPAALVLSHFYFGHHHRARSVRLGNPLLAEPLLCTFDFGARKFGEES